MITSILSFILGLGVAHAEPRTLEIMRAQERCGSYEQKALIDFNSNDVHKLLHRSWDHDGNGDIDPNLVIEIDRKMTFDLFNFQNYYETSVKKQTLMPPKCFEVIDEEMKKLRQDIKRQINS